MNRRRKEANGPNLCKPKDPSHPRREIIAHKGTTQGMSSHILGSIDDVMSGTKEIMRTRKQRWGITLYPYGL
jgi:hypothetical protein